jgi:hypothetical protein
MDILLFFSLTRASKVQPLDQVCLSGVTFAGESVGCTHGARRKSIIAYYVGQETDAFPSR